MVASTPYFDAQISLCKYLIYGGFVPATLFGFVCPTLLHFYVLRVDLGGEGEVTENPAEQDANEE
jgi:hypothetical protein